MKQKIYPQFFLLLVFTCALNSCQRDKPGITTEPATLFTVLKPGKTNIQFRNDVVEDSAWNGLTYNYGYNGGGVACADLDNDGLPDIVFTANQKGATVYRNKGNMVFEDVTPTSFAAYAKGWTTGVTIADVNGDGLNDIYVCKSGATECLERENLLFINKGNFRFVEAAKQFGLNDNSPSTHAVFFDFDNDNDLDCFIVNHPENFDEILNIYAFADSWVLQTGQDRLYENDNGSFKDITETAGLARTYGYGLSVSLSDVNNDGFTDLFIANDYVSNDQLFINNRNKTFTEKTTDYFKQTSLFSMGSDFGDINNDGRQDLLVVDMKPDNHYRLKNNLVAFPNEYYFTFVNSFHPAQHIKNMLQMANEKGFYSDVSQLCGVDKTDWSWSALIQDFDNDGWNDIHITNGTKRDLHDLDFIMLNETAEADMNYMHNLKDFYKQMPTVLLKDYAFKNKGELEFEDVSKKWGLNAASVSNGAAYADFDNDGDMDLVVNNTDSVAFLFQNNSKQENGKYLRVKLKGLGANTAGYGATCKITYANEMQVKELQNGRGFQSCSEPILHFGLGNTHVVETLQIWWPGGNYTELKNVPADTSITLVETNTKAIAPYSTAAYAKLLTQVTNNGLNYSHFETLYNDFKAERFLPYQLSKEGPGIATADINGDGLDDVFIGNGFGGSSALFFQNKNGSFTKSTNQPFIGDTLFEALGVLFFDCNNDGFADLYIATGSNEFEDGDAKLADRLYLNDGKGKFTEASNRLPAMFNSNSCVINCDYDGDGDEDLFVGGRLTARKFPLAGKSKILQNNNGYFTDVTASIAPGLESVGMVNSAVFTDFNTDGNFDLVIAGDWMPVSFFKNTGGKFENVTAQSCKQQLHGFWKSLAAVDVDNDGDMDYVAGNLGQNTFLKAAQNTPLEILYNDFDKNGVKEPLLFHYIKNERAPFIDRNTFGEQMPKYRNTFLSVKAFAGYNWGNFFNSFVDSSVYFRVNELSSGVFINTGKGSFTFTPLPYLAQISTVFGTAIFDFNADGNSDILLQGNWESNYFSQSQYDAGQGLLLAGNGKGGFEQLSFAKSGFYQPDDAKALANVTVGGNPCFISSACNANISCFTLTDGTKYRTLKTQPAERVVTVSFNNGKKQRIEVKNMAGYLSQSSTTVFLPASAISATITGNSTSRTVTF